MPSPFPGMNPYLERDSVWHDFHERFCPLAAEMLTAQVRPNYIVKIDQHLYVHELDSAARNLLGRSDVDLRQTGSDAAGRSATATLSSPAQVRLPAVDIERISFLEILDRESARVVTVLELLSPSNKAPGPDREQYLGKRAHLLNSAVHLLEPDLLRGGPRLPLEDMPACDYHILVSRWPTRPVAESWPLRLRDRLPVIPVPLQSPHDDARLDLQELLNRIYDGAGYEDYIYRGQPQPCLNADDAAWAGQFVPKVAR